MTAQALHERAFKTELDPTVAQEALLMRHVGGARVAHNWALERWNGMNVSRALARFARACAGIDWSGMEAAGWISFFLQALDHGERKKVKTPKDKPERFRYVLHVGDVTPDVLPSGEAMHAALVHEKNRPESPIGWMSELSSFVIREAVGDVADGWKHFFEHLRAGRYERAGTPRFRRADQRRFHADQPDPIRVTERTITIPGIGEVRLKERGYFPVTLPNSCRFPYGGKVIGVGIAEHGGRWYVSMRASVPVLPTQRRAPGAALRARPTPRKAGLVVGVDTGVRYLAVTSLGHKFPSLEEDDVILTLTRRLNLWERRKDRRYRPGLARKEQSAGWHEACREIAKYHRMVTQVRDKRVEKAVRTIVDTGAVKVVVRGQPVTDMLRRKDSDNVEQARARNALAPRVHQARMGDFARRLGYKMKWAGGECIVTEPEYQSSRRCSACGVVRATDPGYPTFRCESCGHAEDREENSAKNLRDYTPEAPPGEPTQDHGTPSGDPAGSGRDGRGKARAGGDNGRQNRKTSVEPSSSAARPEASATGDSRSAVATEPLPMKPNRVPQSGSGVAAS